MGRRRKGHRKGGIKKEGSGRGRKENLKKLSDEGMRAVIKEIKKKVELGQKICQRSKNQGAWDRNRRGRSRRGRSRRGRSRRDRSKRGRSKRGRRRIKYVRKGKCENLGRDDEKFGEEG